MVGEFKTDTVTIKRPTRASTGLEGAAATIATGVRCRLEVGQFKRFDSANEYEDDFFDFKAFFKKNVDIKKADIIEHSGGENYTVVEVKLMKELDIISHIEVKGVSRD